jgi:hypothetical protein
MEFVTHFWNPLALREIEVLVTIQPKIECFRYSDNSVGRKKLAKDCYDRVLGRETEDITMAEDDSDDTDEPSTLLSS